jgi:hypothetical protein
MEVTLIIQHGIHGVANGWEKKNCKKQHAPRPTKIPKYTIVEKDKEALH